MAPKRRAASAAKAGGKKAKEETPKAKDAFTSAKEALLAAGPQVKGKRKVDEMCQVARSAEVRNMLYPSLPTMRMTDTKIFKVKILCVVSSRCMKIMTACSTRQTLEITTISFMSFKFSQKRPLTFCGTDGAEW